MNISEQTIRGGPVIVVDKPSQQMLDLSRELPGRRAWRDGRLLIEPSGDNIDALVARFPFLRERRLPTIERTLEIRANAEMVRRGSPPEAAAFRFKTKPYAHQLEAFGLSRHAEYFGLLMEMGTGKTKILIDTAFSLYAEGEIDRVLVLSINGVHMQWIEEQLPLHALDEIPWEGKAYRSGMGKRETRKWRDLLSSEGLAWFTMAYESLGSSQKAQDAFLEVLLGGRTMLILDESQKIKTPKARRTKFILGHAGLAKYRRIATGTPVTNGVEDYFTQLSFLEPKVLGQTSFYAFRARYCQLMPIPGAPPGAMRVIGYQNLDDLRERIAGCTYEVLKEDCLDLPDKVYRKQYVELTAQQARLYKTMKDYLLAQLDDGKIVDAPMAVTQVMKLQQIVCGHLIDDEGEVHDLPNNRIAAAMDALEESGSMIIWARFRHDIRAIGAAAEKAGYSVGLYYGGTPDEERRRIVEPGAVDVLVANPQSAGAGLNLSHFSRALYYSNSFSADQRWQSEDRIHRIGQDRKCIYTDLISPKTIDVKILAALRDKRDVADSLRAVQDLLTDEE